MLKTWIPEEIPEKEELKKRIKEAGEKLYQQQMKLKEHKLPVLVLFEGWGASGTLPAKRAEKSSPTSPI